MTQMSFFRYCKELCTDYRVFSNWDEAWEFWQDPMIANLPDQQPQPYTRFGKTWTLGIEYHLKKAEQKFRRDIQHNKRLHHQKERDKWGYTYTAPIPKLTALWDDIELLHILKFNVFGQHPFVEDIDKRMVWLQLGGATYA